MKALSQLGFLRTPFQSTSQAVRPALLEEAGNFRKVPSQLLFDLELEEGLESRSASRPASAAITKLEQVMLPFSEAHSQLLREAEQAWRKIASQTRGTGTSALADALKQIGYEACPRMAIGGGGGGAACLQKLCHRYVSCSVQDSGAIVAYVVDPHFREQFEIARPTANYRGLLAAIPDVVVLPEEQVTHLVQLLCHELGECFKQIGEAIPPWRRPASMASKWQPRHSLDGGVVNMTANSSMDACPSQLTRASAVPIVGELSRRLPSSRCIGPRNTIDGASGSTDDIKCWRSAAEQPPTHSRSPFSSEPERFESHSEGNQLATDVRRLLALY